MRCDGITKGARTCKRNARYAYGKAIYDESGEFQGYRTVAGLCSQHYHGLGVMRLLGPSILDFDIIREIEPGGSLGDVVATSPAYELRLGVLQGGESR
jgi:hypothetical protein